MIPEVKLNNGFPNCVHLSVEFNPHAVNYQSLQEWIDGMTDDGEFFYDWISIEERDKSLATNNIWVAQWYPTTPVGFNTAAASSFDALMSHFAPSAARPKEPDHE